jgi:hypothetical protein
MNQQGLNPREIPEETLCHSLRFNKNSVLFSQDPKTGQRILQTQAAQGQPIGGYIDPNQWLAKVRFNGWR